MDIMNFGGNFGVRLRSRNVAKQTRPLLSTQLDAVVIKAVVTSPPFLPFLFSLKLNDENR